MYQNGYQPQMQQFNQQQAYAQQQPIHGFVYVNGIEGARTYAYRLPPNSDMPLFDSNTDKIMYAVTTDGAGYPTIKTVDCSGHEDQPAVSHDYVTRDEAQRMYNDLANQVEQMKGLMNVPVPAPTATAKPTAQQAPRHQADG
jgi:hypothetical protein